MHETAHAVLSCRQELDQTTLCLQLLQISLAFAKDVENPGGRLRRRQLGRCED